MERREKMKLGTDRKRGSIIPLLMALAFLFSVCQGSLLLAGDKDREKYEEKFDKTVSLPVTGAVSVSNISGDITITTWNKGEVKISATKVSWADTLERAKENAALVEINVEKVGNRVVITTEYPENMGRRGRSINVSVDYNLTIPDRASIRAKSISGDVDAGRIGGEAELGTVSGDVVAQGMGGEAELSSVSGDVTARDAEKGLDCHSVSGDVKITSVKGGAKLKSVSGDVSLTGCQGDVEAGSVSGEIELRDITGARRVKAKNVSGDIDYRGTIESEGRYTLESHSGDVTFSVPRDSSFELEAKTFSGEIDTAFPIQVIGKQKKRTLSGTIGEGGAWVELTTFSGDINIKSR